MNEENNELILIVEDNIDIADGLSALIQEIGPKCAIANDGLIALQQIYELKEKITFVLCDLKLPQLNGLDLIRKTYTEVKNIPFVIMTASSSFKLEEEIMQLGVIDYLLKPFDIDLLMSKIPIWITDGKKFKNSR